MSELTFDELITSVLHEQDCETHYSEAGQERLMGLHRQYRAEAIERLRDWVAETVAAERERWVKAADNWATHYKAQGKEAKFLALNHFAAVIRTGAGEGDIDNPPVV